VQPLFPACLLRGLMRLCLSSFLFTPILTGGFYCSLCSIYTVRLGRYRGLQPYPPCIRTVARADISTVINEASHLHDKDVVRTE
jgi:hypothetical protein